MKKIVKWTVLTVLPLASPALAYMPPPANTHWDGYGSKPYSQGPSQPNQHRQASTKSNAPKTQLDPNFNSDQFSTSSPNYRNYESPGFERDQYYYNGQYHYPNPTLWQYQPIDQPSPINPNATKPQPVYQNQLQPYNPNEPEKPQTYRYVPQK